MERRQFLGRSAGMGMAIALGHGFWEQALAAPAQPGESPYGPLQAPDANGLMLPAGFTSRVVAHSLLPVPGTAYPWNVFPDGGACFETEDGGWIYVCNSENPPPADVPGASVLVATLLDVIGLGGRASAIRFAPDGSIVDAYSVLEGTASNCSGGITPWGTWLSCEEFEVDGDAGRVWECDPTGTTAAVAREPLGVFKHEMVGVDPVGQRLYLSEDQPDGRFYRFTPTTWGDLSAGVLEAAQLAPSGAVTWMTVPDPTAVPLRSTIPATTPFDGGEGVVFDQGRVYFTTKGDNRVWVHDVAADTIHILYDAAEHAAPPLTGVDNIIVSAAHDLYVAEDGGNLEVVMITAEPDVRVAPVVRLTGLQHGMEIIPGVPTTSEVSGIAFSPDGDRLYLNSMRGDVTGILYEVRGPWRGGALAAAPSGPASAPEPVPAAPAPSGGQPLPATGGTSPLLGAGLAGAAGAALWALRQRAERATPPSP